MFDARQAWVRCTACTTGQVLGRQQHMALLMPSCQGYVLFPVRPLFHCRRVTLLCMQLWPRFRVSVFNT